jgi:mannose-1-phosphate guanylyltransferase
MQALVLVGGEGTRLRPLTETVPKPVLPLVGKPMLAYTIEWLAGHGVEEVVLACGFLPGALRELLGEGEPGGPRLRYVAEPEPRGTAGAIRFAEPHLGERFLALNGDVLADLDLSALVRAHEEFGGQATLGLYPVEDPSAYGLVRRRESGEIIEFIEKPESPQEIDSDEINAGTYVLERSVLDLIATDRPVSIEREVFPRLVGNGLFGIRLEGYWMDLGTPERYLQASWDILEGRVVTRVEPPPGAVLVAAGATIASDAVVGPRAVISAGCRIDSGAEVRESVLFDGTMVGAGARVSRSILSPGVEVAPGATVEDAVVGAHERVAAQ